MRKTNLTQTQVRVIRADLIDQGIIKEVMYGSSKKYEYQFGAPDLDTKPFERLRQFKFSELDKITEYADSKTCRMDFLCSYLGDTSVGKCEKCDNDLQMVHSIDLNNFWHKKINEFKDNYFPELPVEMKTSKMVNGIASSYYGFSNVGSIIHRCKYENGGDFPGFLMIKTLKAFRYKFKDEKFDLLVYVPPTESGDLVKNFAAKISQTLNIPISHNLRKVKTTEPQKAFQNSVLKRDNIKNAFTFESPSFIQGKKILVVDDVFDSGATIKEIGWMFSKLGASEIAPIVIAKTIGGDI